VDHLEALELEAIYIFLGCRFERPSVPVTGDRRLRCPSPRCCSPASPTPDAPRWQPPSSPTSPGTSWELDDPSATEEQLSFRCSHDARKKRFW
jgi:hypothetical protein